MRYSRFFVFILIFISMNMMTACGSKLPAMKPFKMDIQQGNVVTSKMLLQLRPGMTKSQVRYIMGTPLVLDSFHGNRWDYFYQMRQQGKVTEKRRVILDFENELLTAVRGDVVAANDKTVDEPVNTAARSVTPPKPEEKSSWLDKLKFWKKDEQAQTATAEALAKSAETKPALESIPAVPAQDTAVGVAETGAVAAGVAIAAEASASEPESILKKKIEPKEVDPFAEADKVPAPPALPSTPSVQEVKPSEPAVVVEPLAKEEVAPPVVTEKAADEMPVKSEAVTQPESQASAADLPDVTAAVNAWADAWRSKNIQAYLASYSAKFIPDGLPSKKAWVAQRKQRLSKKQGNISLALEDIKVQQSGNLATAEFVQKYQSKVYKDEVIKQLNLAYDEKAKRWLILKETVITNSAAPSGKLTNQPTSKASDKSVLPPEDSSEHLDGVIEKIGF